MKKLFDLRFVIGVFFLTTGTLLLIYHFISPTKTEMSPSVNQWSGLLYVVFGIFMVGLSYAKDISEDEKP